jgi:dTDP-glucose pyrophosphorylase
MKLTHTHGHASLCKTVANPENFGIFTVDTNGKPTGIVEKPIGTTVGNLANIGNHKFDDTIFADL